MSTGDRLITCEACGQTYYVQVGHKCGCGVYTKPYYKDGLASTVEETETLRRQNKEWEKSVKKREEYITKLEWQKNNLIEDSEYWFSLADKYAIRNIPAVIERAKQHNALMQESEKIIK